MNMIEFCKPYLFTISEFKFGDLSKGMLVRLFSDGRVASKFLERHITIWFPELHFVDKNGYDFIHEDGSRYEAKCFTKSGLNYSASKYRGIGRTIDLDEHANHASTIKYILCDIVSFPKLQIVFVEGKTLLAQYPKGVIKYAERHNLFCERSNLFD